jgi:hypothetical protein
MKYLLGDPTLSNLLAFALEKIYLDKAGKQ